MKFFALSLRSIIACALVAAFATSAIAQKPIAVPTKKRTETPKSNTTTSRTPKGGTTSKSNQRKAETPEAKFKRIYAKALDGDKNAQFDLGLLYYNGEGVAKDLKKAFYWWHEAGDQNLAAAQLNVAICYHEGIGTTQDFDDAIEWYDKVIANPSSNSTQVSNAKEYRAQCIGNDSQPAPSSTPSYNANYTYPSNLTAYNLGTHLYGILPLDYSAQQISDWGRRNSYNVELKNGTNPELWLRNGVPFTVMGYRPKTVCFRVEYKQGMTPYVHNWMQFSSKSEAQKAAEAAAQNLKNAGLKVTKDGKFWMSSYNGCNLLIYAPGEDYISIDLHSKSGSFNSSGSYSSDNYTYPSVLHAAEIGTHMFGVLPLSLPIARLKNWCSSKGYTLEDTGKEVSMWLRGYDIPFTMDGGYKPKTVRFKMDYDSSGNGYVFNWFDFNDAAIARKAAEAAVVNLRNSGYTVSQSGEFWKTTYNGRSMSVYYPSGKSYFSISLHK